MSAKNRRGLMLYGLATYLCGVIVSGGCGTGNWWLTGIGCAGMALLGWYADRFVDA